MTLDTLPLNDPEHFGDKVTSNEMSSMIPSSSFTEDEESIQSPNEKEAREEDSEYSAESHSEKNDQPGINEVVFGILKLSLELNSVCLASSVVETDAGAALEDELRLGAPADDFAARKQRVFRGKNKYPRDASLLLGQSASRDKSGDFQD